MAANVVPKSTSVSLKLNNGTSATGNQLVKGVSLGPVKWNADVDGVWAVAQSLAPCLDKSVLRVERTETVVIESGGADNGD